MLARGVEINETNFNGKSALEWSLDAESVCTHDFAVIAFTRSASARPKGDWSLERSEPIVGLLLEHGAHWESLDVLDPRASKILESHPVIRRKKLTIKAADGVEHRPKSPQSQHKL